MCTGLPLPTAASYDAAYLELALRRSLPLATLDDDLIRASQLAGVAVIRETA